MDNKLFNVNGRSLYQFKKTIELMLIDEYYENGLKNSWFVPGSGVRGYKIDRKKGLVLYWRVDELKGIKSIDELLDNKLIEKYDLIKSFRKYKLEQLESTRNSIPTEILTYVLWEWLQTYDGEIDYEEWEENLYHDGSNEKGFRVYVDQWGKVEYPSGMTIDHDTLFAVKPVYLWYGK